jgi:hypothetical protein
MTRIYTNPGYWWRNTVSLVVLVLIAIYGVWELWRASGVAGEEGLPGYLFGVAFVGGAAYGLWQTINDARDRVMTFDIEEASGRSLAAFWRPFWTEKLAAEPGEIHDWRLHVAIGSRNAKTFFVYADHRRYPRPLQFELRQNVDVTELRKIAPEAVTEYDRAIGRAG